MYPWIIYYHQDCRLITCLDPGFPFKVWQKLDRLEEYRFPSHVYNNLGTLQTSKQREQGGALLALHQRGGYLDKNFEKTLLSTLFLTNLDLLLGSRSIHFIVIHSGNLSKVIDFQRGCSQRDLLYLCIFFDGAGIFATQIQHIIKVSTYIFLKLVQVQSILYQRKKLF